MILASAYPLRQHQKRQNNRIPPKSIGPTQLNIQKIYNYIVVVQLAWSHPYWCATTSALCTNIPCSWATTRVCTLQIVSMIVYQEFELIDIPMALACEPHLPPQTAEGIPSKYVLVAVLSSRNTQQVKSFCPPTPKRTSTPTLQHYNLTQRTDLVGEGDGLLGVEHGTACQSGELGKR